MPFSGFTIGNLLLCQKVHFLTQFTVGVQTAVTRNLLAPSDEGAVKNL